VTRDIDDPMEAEFDTVAEWTALVAADLGPEYYIPAACRGSGQPPPDWAQRVEVVERELHRRYGHRPELTTADEQSRRIGHLLSSGQLTSQVILLRCAPPPS
jgi:hypothetical protein